MSDYWTGQWPNMASVSIVFPPYVQWALEPATIGILYRLVAHVAFQGVHTAYREPNLDPSFPDDEVIICRIAGCTKAEWNEALPQIADFFSVSNGKWRLVADFIRYTRPSVRPGISSDAKAAAIARDGQRCVYCGTIEGPFHLDHIFPFSKGGNGDATNLVVACVPCNRSKADMTLREWMESMR